MSVARSTTYRRVRIPRTCTFEEGLFYIPKFLNDRQLCEMWGVEYHGITPEDVAAAIEGKDKNI